MQGGEILPHARGTDLKSGENPNKQMSAVPFRILELAVVFPSPPESSEKFHLLREGENI